MTEPVLFERDGPISRVTFNRPDQRNALTLPMYERFARLCRRVNADAEARVLVLQGAAGAFIAGMDIGDFDRLLEADDPLDYSRRMDDVFAAVENVRVATIAAIDGPAVGAGAAIAAACDLRIASRRARFGFPIARTVGNALSARNLARVASIVGVGRAKELLFNARLLDAEEMKTAGLVSEVVPDEEAFRARVDEVAARVASLAPLTLRATKEVLLRVQEQLTPDGAQDAVAAAYMSADFREGINAFRERRTPNWRGE